MSIEKPSSTDPRVSALGKLKDLIEQAQNREFNVAHEQASAANERLDEVLKKINQSIASDKNTGDVIQPFSSQELLALYKADPQNILKLLGLIDQTVANEIKYEILLVLQEVSN